MYKIEDEKYIRAKNKIACMRKFYSSLTKYLFVIALLGGINYYLNEWSNAWFLWAAFGWGIGLVFQAIKAFDLNPFFGKDWEKRKIQEFMQQDEGKERWK
ncbi:MAG: 2TM domain-containing protein [Maribacter sp.]|uniref:2TM domain-containing protein n=1 Tax=Maribacter sp. 2307UL18-2 TaxID=3386274 RepID=UPI0039BC750F